MPLLGPTMEDRNQVFQRLKPPCVALSQAALALNGPNAEIKTATERLESLKRELSMTVQGQLLDEKLADYVFFPLSQVLKASQKVSIRCLELAFQCLSILIGKGWRSRIQPQLAAQVVILCTMMSERKPKGIASTESTDEFQASALACLFHLFDALDSSSETRNALISETNFPQLGQTISTILDAILDGVSADVQITATKALTSLVKNVATRDVKAGFLPGIVSKLTKVLTPQTSQRRNHAVLIGALEVLQLLFSDALGDTSSKSLSEEQSQQSTQSTVIDEKWLQNASSQLKPAVASIMKVRDHSRFDVREALASFCFVILKQCRQSLANCASLALETVLLLSSQPLGEVVKFKLESLVEGESSISNLIQGTLFDWLQSIPTQMQGAEEQAKVQRLRQITTAYGLAVTGGVNTPALDRLLANVLRDSVVITLQLPKANQQGPVTISPVQTFGISLLESDRGRTDFSTPLVKYRGQQEVIEAIEQVTKSITSTSSSASAFASDLARSLRQSHGETQLAAFWLLLKSMETLLDQTHQADIFLDIEDETSAAYKDHLENIFAFSLDFLNDASDDLIDPRLQSLALRTLALRARTTGKEFRFELVDALYPVLHTLATPNEDLQKDSIATLNILTEACGYDSVKSLIVDNADYLTNAVALKLNAFDISPQAPQVLLMMVRLAGPSLLPYLEDTINSIFAALRDYHGYPLLVELLFKVLAVVAEEGSKAPQLAISDGKTERLARSRIGMWEPTSIDSLVDLLEERRNEEINTRSEEINTRSEDRTESHPKRPWNDNNIVDKSAGEEPIEDEEPLPADIEPSPPAPKVYGLLLKILELTQHFLPSASAALRMSLLSLIKTTIPAIARHENSFLPLINTLWPEIVSRLDDAEPSVVASALDIIALLCQYAGDFMRSRAIQLWPGLIQIYQRTAKEIVQSARSATIQRAASKNEDWNELVLAGPHLKQAISRMQSTAADYSDTSTRLIWTSLVHAITAAVEYVDLSPDHFDEALEMLGSVLEQPEVREAFETENSDAVWLARIRNGTLTMPQVPIMGINANW